VALAAAFCYLAIIGYGIILPRCEMYADVVERGEPGRHRVALTFDDGPDPSTTPIVLAALRKRGFRATFFVIGKKAEAYPDLIRTILQQGHELGIHGYLHANLTALHAPARIMADIRRAQDVLENLSGQRVFWYRPPVGHVSPRTAVAVRKAGVELVAWSLRCVDGLRRSDPKRVAARIEHKLHDGAIILLHDAAEGGDFVPAAVRVIDPILDSIAGRGLTSVTLSELLVAHDLTNDTPPQKNEPH
jgi:peptidoglycan/xylan/chitin deacetylase (PgdA/CDA1 family)